MRVVRSFRKLVVVPILAVLLSGCHEEVTVSSAPIKLPSTQLASSLFRQLCVENLPNFASFETDAISAGLVRTGPIGPIRKPYRVPDQFLVLGVANSPAGTVCNITFDTTESANAVGSKILTVARNGTGRGREKPFPSSFFQFAIQLPNGSLVTQDSRQKTASTVRNIFFISGPVNESQIRTLIYN